MIAVFKRELKAYFTSTIGYAFMGFFLVVSGLMFSYFNLMQYDPSFNSILTSLVLCFVVVVPILTMRLLSEERKNKTDQLLLTSPLSLTQIVVGKYLAAVALFLITVLLTSVYSVILMIYGNPSLSDIFAGMFGFFLMGSALISIGLFVSSLCENQVSAAVSTFGVLLLMFILDYIVPEVDNVFLATILDWLSVNTRYTDFVYGAINLSSVVYYLTIIAIFLFLTVRSLEKRRWSES